MYVHFYENKEKPSNKKNCSKNRARKMQDKNYWILEVGDFDNFGKVIEAFHVFNVTFLLLSSW